MSPLMLHAVGLARCGEWRLLDALEVVARATDEPKLAGILHFPGDLALLGYSDADISDAPSQEECSECEGSGEVELVGASGRIKYMDCPWCDGAGHREGDGQAPHAFRPRDVRRWMNLRGGKVKGIEGWDESRWMDRATAALTVKQYEPLVEKLAA